MNPYSTRQITILFLFSLIAIFSKAQDVDALFKKNCGACHTIGGGKTLGPDLAGITSKKDQAWLIKFIKNSQQVIASGDAEAVAIAKEFNNSVMPPVALSDGEIVKILKHIESKGGGSAKPQVDFLKNATSENVQSGYRLFTGAVKFKEGGAACNTCHNIKGINNGGLLAKDLTFSYNAMKSEGVKSMLEFPTFPAMLDAYKNNPLTPEEIKDLAAYMRATAKSDPASNVKETTVTFMFHLLSVAGFCTVLLLLYGGWQIRKKISVNSDIIKRQLNTKHQ